MATMCCGLVGMGQRRGTGLAWLDPAVNEAGGTGQAAHPGARGGLAAAASCDSDEAAAMRARPSGATMAVSTLTVIAVRLFVIDGDCRNYFCDSKLGDSLAIDQLEGN